MQGARDFAGDVAAEVSAGATDYKPRLQELTQRRFRASPAYQLVSEQGPDHAKSFAVELSVAGRLLGRGTGPSKKAAEQVAAMEALQRIESEPDDT